MEKRGSGRDYVRLFTAMNRALGVLLNEGSEKEALQISFEAAAEGFGAENAILLVVEGQQPLSLRSLHVRGRLSPEQLQACERGESVRGVSPSVIRRSIESGTTELIEDPRCNGSAAVTDSLRDGDFSVLCAPISDPLRELVLAVIYFQNAGLAQAYTESDRLWLQGYATVLGQAFGFHFAQQRRERDLRERLAAIDGPENAPELVGDSSWSQSFRRELHTIWVPAIEAPNPDPILIVGERGAGKDLLARYLYSYSGRRERLFVVVNAAEVTDELASSRFFGHKKGSFTGAMRDEPGAFRAAQGGVLFLDEVADLSPRAQACLLRVLENHAVVPLGETREIPIDVAVVLATNRDLRQAVASGSLRADFYDRFRTQCIVVKPLRERPWDVPALLEHFRRHHEARMRKWTLGFSQGVFRAMVAYTWPGNVRELARTCSLLVTHATPGSRIDEALLRRCCPDMSSAAPNPAAAPLLAGEASFEDAVRAFERELILSRLERHDGDTRAARESLGLNKSTFHRYLKALGISSPSASRISDREGVTEPDTLS